VIYVETNFMHTLTVQQLRALSTDAKVETWRALHGRGVPSEEELFSSMSPQEQAQVLYNLMHPGVDTETEDRLDLYLQLRENLAGTKRSLMDSIKLLKEYPNAGELEVLELLRNSSHEMNQAMSEFRNKLSEFLFV